MESRFTFVIDMLHKMSFAQVLAGFTVTGLIEFQMPPETHRGLQVHASVVIFTICLALLKCSLPVSLVFRTSLSLRFSASQHTNLLIA